MLPLKTIVHQIAVALLLSALSFVVSASASEQAANAIHVQVTGARSDKGQIVCALFSAGNGFPSKAENAFAHARSTIHNGSAVCGFADVGPGRYAVSVFHDENSNDKMDANFIGIPKEGVGSSNDARGRMGPPKFDAAAFQYEGGLLELRIKLFYP